MGNAAMERFHCFEEESSQARFMKERGDLSKTSFSFQASLPAAAPHSRAKGLGMDIVRAKSQSKASLLVADVDNDPRQATPVAEWNTREDRQAYRSEEERHVSLAIKPGDKICAVNGTSDDDLVMEEILAAAADLESPKPVELTLERTRSDVLGPPGWTASLPPRPPTSGTGDSMPRRCRSSSQPHIHYLSGRPGSVASDIAPSTTDRRHSEPNIYASPVQLKTLLSSPALQTRGRTKRADEEGSTRSPSLSLSVRSSSVSTCDKGPPIVISTRKSQTLARVGLSTLGSLQNY